MEITSRTKRNADNLTVIFKNFSKIYGRAVKRFGKEKVITYLSNKCYKMTLYTKEQNQWF